MARAFRSRPDLRPPTVTVTTRHTRASSDPILLNLDGPLLVDNEGEPLWYRPSGARATANLRAQRYRGEPVLTWWEGTISKPGFGRGEYVMVDGSYRELHRLSAGNGYRGDLHEFVVTPTDTALLMAYTVVPADLRAVGGKANGTILDCVVQEVDIASGRVLFEWHAHEHVPLTESHANVTPGQPFDFFHANSVAEDADDNLLISARNTWAIYKVDRRSGAVMWRLGGKASDFALADGVAFAWQHDARRQSDGTITLFDDGADPKVESRSRGLVLRLDETAKRASVVQEYAHHQRLAGSQGSMQILPNGDAFVGWGALPNVSEFSQDGRLLFDAGFAGGRQSYRAVRAPWSARPAEPPSLAVERRADGSLIAHASWNGATDVARWEVLGGAQSGALRSVATAPRLGFETAVTVRPRPAFAAVRALDGRGSELGHSVVVPT